MNRQNIINMLYKKAEKKYFNLSLPNKYEKLFYAKQKNEDDYLKLFNLIKQLPPQSHDTLFKALDDYLMSQSLLSSYENEYFYKTGFKDSIAENKRRQKNKQ